MSNKNAKAIRRNNRQNKKARPSKHQVARQAAEKKLDLLSRKVIKETSDSVFGMAYPMEQSALVAFDCEGKAHVQIFDAEMTEKVFEDFTLEDSMTGIAYIEHIWVTEDKKAYKTKPVNVVSAPGRHVTLIHRNGKAWANIFFPGVQGELRSPESYENAITHRLRALINGEKGIPSKVRAQAALFWVVDFAERVNDATPNGVLSIGRKALLTEFPENQLMEWFHELVEMHMAAQKISPKEIGRVEDDFLNLMQRFTPLELKERLFANAPDSDRAKEQFNILFGLAA